MAGLPQAEAGSDVKTYRGMTARIKPHESTSGQTRYGNELAFYLFATMATKKARNIVIINENISRYIVLYMLTGRAM